MHFFGPKWKYFKFSKVEASMKGQPYFVEVKYDGERMQLHMADGKFKYFSRGCVLLFRFAVEENNIK